MTTSFSRGISSCRFFRLCWRAPVILITCAGILTRDVEPISQAQLFSFTSEIAFSTQCLARRNAVFVAKMKVSIVIPCYNEKNTIEKVVEAVRNAPLESREIIVVDDCSQDGTQAVLQQRVARMVDRVIYHPVNRGKGAALRSGFAAATGDTI